MAAFFNGLLGGNMGLVGSSLSVLASVATIMILYGLLEQKSGLPTWTAIIAAIAFVGLFGFGMLWRFHYMPSQDFADVMVSDRPCSESIQITSLHIRRVCRRFLRKARYLTREYQVPGSAAPGLPQIGRLPDENTTTMVERLEDNLKGIYYDIRYRSLAYSDDKARSRRRLLPIGDQSRSVSRISDMICTLSQETGIPYGTLCRSVFRFDPATFLAWAQFFRRNVVALDVAWGGEANEDAELRALLIKGCGTAQEMSLECATHQYWLVHYCALHEHLRDISSVSSLGGACIRYARAVQDICARALSESHRRFGQPHEVTDNGGRRLRGHLHFLADTLRALDLLRRMARTHVGIDLHIICGKVSAHPFFYGYSTRPIGIDGKPNVEGWEGLLRDLGDALAGRSAAPSLVVKSCWESTRACAQSAQAIQGRIVRSRLSLASQVSGAINGIWSCERHDQLVLATHGFSAAVRSAIVDGLFAAGSGVRGAISEILILSTSPQDDARAHEMRELLARRKHREGLDVVVSVVDASGVRFALRDRQLVVGLFGAELFDSDSIVQQRDGGQELYDVLCALRQRGEQEVVAILVAEEYKQFELVQDQFRHLRRQIGQVALLRRNTNARDLDQLAILLPGQIRPAWKPKLAY